MRRLVTLSTPLKKLSKMKRKSRKRRKIQERGRNLRKKMRRRVRN